MRRGDGDDTGTTPVSPPARWLLWLVVFGAPVLWLLHFMAAYLFTETICRAAASVAPDRGAGIALVGVTLLFALGGLALTLIALRVRRHALASPPIYDDFLARIGVLSSPLFTALLLLETLPPLLLGMCR